MDKYRMEVERLKERERATKDRLGVERLKAKGSNYRKVYKKIIIAVSILIFIVFSILAYINFVWFLGSVMLISLSIVIFYGLFKFGNRSEEDWWHWYWFYFVLLDKDRRD